jgi:hypothetical protein
MKPQADQPLLFELPIEAAPKPVDAKARKPMPTGGAQIVATCSPNKSETAVQPANLVNGKKSRKASNRSVRKGARAEGAKEQQRRRDEKTAQGRERVEAWIPANVNARINALAKEKMVKKQELIFRTLVKEFPGDVLGI